VYDAVSSWTVYHFHDTSMLAPMRRDQSVRDFERLRSDASNIAAYLLHLRDRASASYALIRDTVRLIAPFFDDFLLRPEEKGGEEKLRLEWQQKGSDFPFQPNHLSDGTIRFICLTTALLQPQPPATIVIDEPELGLHPYAIALLAELIHSAAKRTQLVISTQSATLLDYFEPEEIVVVNRAEGASTFERLEPKKLLEWLVDYSVGELWQKNVVRGGPNGG
jgi:predicted ATPase